ncbi:hypothetical protein [Rossellomorea marisflavi]|uniref:hypothetical protein n=1 Tax=Rossellomorea marisflavi TaxID=189381 RepID=UPI003FA06602
MLNSNVDMAIKEGRLYQATALLAFRREPKHDTNNLNVVKKEHWLIFERDSVNGYCEVSRLNGQRGYVLKKFLSKVTIPEKEIVKDERHFEVMGINNVSLEQFLDAVHRIEQFMELGQESPIETIDSKTIACITFRDSANYKYDFWLQLNTLGQILICEPEWNNDESSERDFLLGVICTEFGVTQDQLYI